MTCERATHGIAPLFPRCSLVQLVGAGYKDTLAAAFRWIFATSGNSAQWLIGANHPVQDLNHLVGRIESVMSNNCGHLGKNLINVVVTVA